MKKTILFISILAIPSFSCCQENPGSFFGQNLPGDSPTVFADGIVTYPFMNHSSVTLSNEMNEMYWSKWYDEESRQEIVYSELNGNKWSEPEVVSFSGQYSDDVPFLSPDNRRLYFVSRRPAGQDDNSNRERIWFSSKDNEDTWSEPEMISPVVNSEHIHWQFSVAEDYSIFYNSAEGIKLSEYVNGEYQNPKLVKEVLNENYLGGNPFISPKKDYIIFSSEQLPDTKGKSDLYIGFRNENGFWSDPINLGDNINGPKNDLCPIVSPDGKILFYVKQEDVYDIYWVSADFIDRLKQSIE